MLILDCTNTQHKPCMHALIRYKEFVMGLPFLLRQDLEFSLLEHIREKFASSDNEEEMAKAAEQFLKKAKEEKYSYKYHVYNLKKACFKDDEDATNKFINELAFAEKNKDILNMIDTYKLNDIIKKEFNGLTEFVRSVLFFIKRNNINFNEDNLRRAIADHINTDKNAKIKE